jgi:hypothetical protein
MLMKRGLTGGIRLVSKQQIRGMANRGWMNGNGPLDELAGRRETTYKGWTWNDKSAMEIGFGFVLPIIVFGSMICNGMDGRRARMGRAKE